jgi:hypothetical protein
MKSSDLPPPDEDLAKWEAEYSQLMEGQRSDLDVDYGAMMEEAWRGSHLDGTVPDAMPMFDDQGLPRLESYEFGMCSSLTALIPADWKSQIPTTHISRNRRLRLPFSKMRSHYWSRAGPSRRSL